MVKRSARISTLQIECACVPSTVMSAKRSCQWHGRGLGRAPPQVSAAKGLAQRKGQRSGNAGGFGGNAIPSKLAQRKSSAVKKQRSEKAQRSGKQSAAEKQRGVWGANAIAPHGVQGHPLAVAAGAAKTPSQQKFSVCLMFSKKGMTPIGTS